MILYPSSMLLFLDGFICGLCFLPLVCMFTFWFKLLCHNFKHNQHIVQLIKAVFLIQSIWLFYSFSQFHLDDFVRIYHTKTQILYGIALVYWCLFFKCYLSKVYKTRVERQTFLYGCFQRLNDFFSKCSINETCSYFDYQRIQDKMYYVFKSLSIYDSREIISDRYGGIDVLEVFADQVNFHSLSCLFITYCIHTKQYIVVFEKSKYPKLYKYASKHCVYLNQKLQLVKTLTPIPDDVVDFIISKY